MIVLDASAFIALFGAGEQSPLVAALGRSGHWVVPEHFRAEVLSGLRGLWLGRKTDDDELDRAARVIASRPLDVWPTAPLIPRIRELAANATVYDAAYIALAEELGAPLVTVDAKYARVPGIRCRILPDPLP
jgi:predicted nucleic acid-binding protein